MPEFIVFCYACGVVPLSPLQRLLREHGNPTVCKCCQTKVDLAVQLLRLVGRVSSVASNGVM